MLTIRLVFFLAGNVMPSPVGKQFVLEILPIKPFEKWLYHLRFCIRYSGRGVYLGARLVNVKHFLFLIVV